MTQQSKHMNGSRLEQHSDEPQSDNAQSDNAQSADEQEGKERQAIPSKETSSASEEFTGDDMGARYSGGGMDLLHGRFGSSEPQGESLINPRHNEERNETSAANESHTPQQATDTPQQAQQGQFAPGSGPDQSIAEAGAVRDDLRRNRIVQHDIERGQAILERRLDSAGISVADDSAAARDANDDDEDENNKGR